MNLQQLEYILAVDSERHFARAAEQCNVTQPTLSAMIQKLEDELGTKIFDRNAQPIRPTEIGKKVIEQAQVIIRESHTLKDIVREELHSTGGSFRIAVLPTIAPYLLPRFFPHLQEEHPELNLQVMEMKTPNCLAALRAGGADAALLATHPNEKDLQVDTLFYEQFFGYVSRKDPLFEKDLIRTADVSGKKLWLLGEGHCFRDQLTRFCQLDSTRNCQMAYKLGSMETFMRMVESGEGITFIPELAVLQLNNEQKELVRPFALPRPVREITIAVRKDFVRLSVLKLVAEYIRKAVPTEMLQVQGGQKVV